MPTVVIGILLTLRLQRSRSTPRGITLCTEEDVAHALAKPLSIQTVTLKSSSSSLPTQWESDLIRPTMNRLHDQHSPLSGQGTLANLCFVLL